MKKKGRSIQKRLYLLLLICLVPLTCMAVFLLVQVRSFAERYDSVVEKITEISAYNIDFKEDIDYAMYIIVVNADRADELISQEAPEEMVAEARAVFNELYESETSEYGKIYLWRIISCLDILEERITEIEEDALVSGNYDLNMERLELNIYVLTELIQEQIQKYIYYETATLGDLSSNIKADVQQAMTVSMALIVLIAVLALLTSRKLMKGITDPIRVLCEDMKRAGSGDFDVSISAQSNDEMVTLNNGFNQMVQQIGHLVEDIKEEQANLRVMEIGLLQAQINPHFLYNTLDTILWLAETGENQLVVTMVENLSTFFRISLSRGEELISLEEEESHTKSYLEIQRVRYGDILNFRLDIAEEARECILPKLTLQPIVENSLYHGLKNKRGGGTITISATVQEDRLVLTVSDDGFGMTREQLATLRTAILEVQRTEGKGSGFGVYNVNQRIKLYYGDDYGLEIDSCFGIGTTVTVTLPAVYN